VQRTVKTRGRGPEQAEGAGTMKKQLNIKKLILLLALGLHRRVTASLLLQLLFLAVGKVLADGGFEQPAGELCSADNQRLSWKGERTRLFLSDKGYEKALDSQAKGQIKGEGISSSNRPQRICSERS